MSKPYASNRAAKKKADKPVLPFYWGAEFYEMTWDEQGVMIYDDTALADRMAATLGTMVKHSNAKFTNSCWKAFSIVRLP